MVLISSVFGDDILCLGLTREVVPMSIIQLSGVCMYVCIMWFRRNSVKNKRPSHFLYRIVTKSLNQIFLYL